MIYYKIIGWSECPFCLKAKLELISRKVNFEYCSVDHSNPLLQYYKSIYKHGSVPMIIEFDQFTGQEKFIGGYTDLIEYFKKSFVESQIPNVDGNG